MSLYLENYELLLTAQLKNFAILVVVSFVLLLNLTKWNIWLVKDKAKAIKLVTASEHLSQWITISKKEYT